MAKPNFTKLSGAAAWGDLSETSEPMIGNLFAVSIRLPTIVKRLYPLGGSVMSLLASDVSFPDEKISLEKVSTRLSDFDIAVAKTRGTLDITFNEQVGAPALSLLYAWHKSVVDARSGGIGFPNDYKSEIWIASLTGDGTPYYWWGFRRTFPDTRGKPDFGFDKRNHTKVGPISFSYLEYIDIAEMTFGEGGLLGLAKAAAV